MSGKQLQVSKSLQEASEKLAAVIGVNPLEPVFRKAEVVIAVREWLQHPEVMERIRQLKNTPSGFQTDEENRGKTYDDKTLAVAITDALAAGFQLVGNEFNIIAGRAMGVLNGYHRQVREWKNQEWRMAGLEVIEGDIAVNGNVVKVPMAVEYTLVSADGTTKLNQRFERTIQLRQRSNDSPDAWIGKATRRILKKLHVKLTGQDFGDDLGDESLAGSAPAPVSAMPPEGRVDLKKPPKPKEKAEEADWTPVAAGAPASAAEPPPAPEKPYSQMTQPERADATRKAREQADQAPKKPPPGQPPGAPPEDVF